MEYNGVLCLRHWRDTVVMVRASVLDARRYACNLPSNTANEAIKF